MHKSTKTFFSGVPAAAALAFLVVGMLPALGFGHPGHLGHESGWVAGLLHPLTGMDHLLALLGVGIWSQYQQGAARWGIPASFAGAILGGAALAALGLGLPGVELGIAGSVLVVGLLVASARTLPVQWAVAVGAALAVWHGFAHVAEAAQTTSVASYVAGFMVTSLVGMGAGAGIGALLQREWTERYLGRAVGGAIALAGVLLLGAQFGL